jgi:hypothetical protein
MRDREDARDLHGRLELEDLAAGDFATIGQLEQLVVVARQIVDHAHDVVLVVELGILEIQLRPLQVVLHPVRLEEWLVVGKEVPIVVPRIRLVAVDLGVSVQEFHLFSVIASISGAFTSSCTRDRRLARSALSRLRVRSTPSCSWRTR